MIATLLFPVIASALVLLAGRRDAARDPRLTVSLLVLLAAFPVMVAVMPKLALFPAVAAHAEKVRSLGWIIAIVWAAGFAWSMARLLSGMAVLNGWRKRAALVGYIEGVEIRMLDFLESPVAAGILKPVVYVPAAWPHWNEEYRRVVVEHELAHHRRHDPLWRLLARFACTVHWYHPLVHWMTRRFIMQCEYACDSIVLGSGIRAETYASVLCDFASRNSPSPLAPAMAEACPLESRVRRMFSPIHATSGGTLALLGAAGFLTACSLSMLGRQHPSPAVIPPAEVELRLTADPFPGNP